MKRLSIPVLLCSSFLGISGYGLSVQKVPPAKSADVAVYGGTAAGVIAAVAAAREGKTVLLVEPGKHVGGMVSGGLGATDVGNRLAIGGYSREFFDRVRDYYLKKYGPKSDQAKDCLDGFRFEPHVAELVFREMLKEANVTVLFDQRLSRVVLVEGKIKTMDVENNAGVPSARVSAKMFIDASYEGDLMAKAKVSYVIGREGRAQYGESLAGVQKHSAAHQWPVKVSPFADGKTLLPLIQADPPGEPGQADKKTQAYNFRLCMTQRQDQRLPWPKPANYDPKRYELLARYLEKRPDVKVGQLMNPVKVPNGKTDTNNNGPLSTDHIGGNWDYPEANYADRSKIWQDHIDYQMGFHYFLAKDPRVPEKLRNEVNSWGLAKGEFEDTNGWPHQLYVREARRMLGAFVMTQKDIMDERTKEDSVGLGSYNTDSHHVQRVVGPDGFVLNEGDFQVPVKPYAIPYRSLIPKANECGNLLVSVCCSASHVAYGTIRMEPVYMILGQASGVAATLALDEKTSVQKVSIEKLQSKLKAQKAILSPEGIVKAGPKGLDPKKMAGVVVDDARAQKSGVWVFSTSTPGFVGAGYQHDGNAEQGKKSMRFTPKLPQAGNYEVRLHFTAFPNRATNVLVAIHSAEGDKSVRVNQRVQAKDGISLGVFRFEAGEKGYVEIRNDGADGFVIADAVQFVLKE
ncbi:MAG: FAD-dependent oxidoreductase [Gemmataceae bacterium]|nr:FAD-dependent oxidoreductase [Gemmataceae bacterium]MCI0742556.1 FAD-dependent oxidoreductase [Gemmataceae bacterium]